VPFPVIICFRPNLCSTTKKGREEKRKANVQTESSLDIDCIDQANQNAVMRGRNNNSYSTTKESHRRQNEQSAALEQVKATSRNSEKSTLGINRSTKKIQNK